MRILKQSVHDRPNYFIFIKLFPDMSTSKGSMFRAFHRPKRSTSPRRSSTNGIPQLSVIGEGLREVSMTTDRLFTKNSLRWITASHVRSKQELGRTMQHLNRAIKSASLDMDYQKKQMRMRIEGVHNRPARRSATGGRNLAPELEDVMNEETELVISPAIGKLMEKSHAHAQYGVGQGPKIAYLDHRQSTCGDIAARGSVDNEIVSYIAKRGSNEHVTALTNNTEEPRHRRTSKEDKEDKVTEQTFEEPDRSSEEMRAFREGPCIDRPGTRSTRYTPSGLDSVVKATIRRSPLLKLDKRRRIVLGLRRPNSDPDAAVSAEEERMFDFLQQASNSPNFVVTPASSRRGHKTPRLHCDDVGKQLRLVFNDVEIEEISKDGQLTFEDARWRYLRGWDPSQANSIPSVSSPRPESRCLNVPSAPSAWPPSDQEWNELRYCRYLRIKSGKV